MALQNGNAQKLDSVLDNTPKVRIFLKPYAPPAALGLAGFGPFPLLSPSTSSSSGSLPKLRLGYVTASSTFITSMWIAEWWGDASSPGAFFPSSPEDERFAV